MPMSAAQFCTIMNLLFFARNLVEKHPEKVKEKLLNIRTQNIVADLEWWGPEGFDKMVNDMLDFGEQYLAVMPSGFHPEQFNPIDPAIQ